MYSRNKGQTDRDFSLTPPPGYDGSRFRKRSDGRDDAFPLYADERTDSPPAPQRKSYSQRKLQRGQNEHSDEVSHDEQSNGECSIPPKDEADCSPRLPAEKETKGKRIEDFLRGLKNEDILLIVLIVLLAGDQSREGAETILLLALLLCIS